MPHSRRLKALGHAIALLRSQFLPNPFDPLGVYPQPDRVQAHARAFVVLCHAEIESYLEDWAKAIARASEVAWTTSNRVTEPFAFLVATLAEKVVIPTSLAGPNAKDGPQRLIDASVQLYLRYYKQIKDNHGIKEANVLALFSPLGVPASAMGTTLLPNLDSFGSLRGTHAHQAAKSVTNVLDPEIEYKRVNDLVNELSKLDAWLLQYRRRIR